MDPQILASLITVGLTITAGVGGYLFREYRNRAKPFMAITQVEGDLHSGGTRIDVPAPIIQAIKKTTYINKLDSRDRISEIRKSCRESKRVLDNAPELLEMITNFKIAVNNKDIASAQSSLHKILARQLYEMWLTLFLVTDRIIIPRPNEDLPKIVPVCESTENDGCFWVEVPGNTFSFGKNLNKLIPLKHKVAALMALIERMDLPQLSSLFDEIEEHTRTLLEVAKDIDPMLEKILDDNSRWSIRIYTANLGRTPFLINKEGIIHVEDDTGAKYDEECHLVTLSLDDDGNTLRHRSDTPIVAGAEQDVTFEVITTSVQETMKRGGAFREAFTSESAKCRVELTIQQAGMIRTKKLSTPSAEFKES